MSFETDFDTAFTVLLGKAVGAITPISQPTTSTTPGTTTSPISAGFEYVIDGGGSAIANGSAGGLIAPFSLLVNRIVIQEIDGVSGSITVDVRISLPGNSTSFSSIGSLSISSGRYVTRDITATIDQFDAVQYVVSGASTIQRVTVAVLGRRTDV